MILDVALVNRKPECKHVPARDFEKHTCRVFLFTEHSYRATELLYCFFAMSAFCKDSDFASDFVYLLYNLIFVWPEELQTIQLLVTGKLLHVLGLALGLDW